MTFIIVTHDQEEAMTMATRIGVMDAGRLVQVATPRELYEAPRTRWIAQFVGDINVFDGEVRTQDADGLVVETTGAGRIVVARQAGATDRAKLSVAIRPEKIRLARANLSETDSANRLNGVISDVSYLGGTTTYKIRLEAGGSLRASLANTARRASDDYAAGDHVVAWFMPDDCLVLDR
jgi:putrescine transport system ATP-binding protein